MIRAGRRVGVGFKRMDAPVMFRSMHIALADLKLDALYVVYPGNLRYPLAEPAEAIPLTEVGSTSPEARRDDESDGSSQRESSR